MLVQIFSIKNKYKKRNVSFGAGMSLDIYKAINRSNINAISDQFANKNISVDFKDNKIIAWCCQKVLETIEQFNERFGLKFSFPNAIIVDDFEKLNLERTTEKMFGFCNILPSNLYKYDKKVISQNTLFFNTFEQYNKKQIQTSRLILWENIDNISNNNFITGLSPTNSFLDLFFHEFAHCIHIENMLNNFGGETLLKKLIELNNPIFIKKYYQKFHQILIDKLCPYASKNPLETIACDISKRFCISIKDDINLFNNNIYKKDSIIKKLFIKNTESPFNNIIKQFYNGNFNIDKILL